MAAMRVRLLALCMALAMLHYAAAMSSYRAMLPNAGSDSPAADGIVPDPTTDDGFCRSFGHASSCDGAPSGNGNQFGMDFVNANRMWTTTFCKMDSDNDGFSNGAELGDPTCAFTMGGTPTSTKNISHPGVQCSVPSNPWCTVPTGVVPSSMTNVSTSASNYTSTAVMVNTTAPADVAVASSAMVILSAVIATIV
ncbi:temptin-like [Sycon ciliatum]|uniref:temptin-like n=1 Tax=Sycon ciliatum TaxID=27933 RepID=UPI0031F6BA7D